MRKPVIATLTAAGWLGLLLPPTVSAQTVHQDPRGRFSISLPPGFKLSSEQSERMYVFQGPDARLFVTIVPGSSDRDRLWRTALDDFTGPGVPAPAAASVSDLDLNGNPARVAWYDFDGGGTQYSVLLGAVVLRDRGTGIVCFCLLNEPAAARWGEPLREAFRSIREPAPPVISLR